MARNPRYLRCLCISILLLECCSFPRARAQTTIEVPATFNFDRDREPIISLDGVWRFHPGDDPDGKLGWAKPDFDDSSWPLLRSNTGWGEQGYKGYSGFAWYRFKVLLPNEQRRWAISLPRLLTSYQIFADTRLVGQFGGMPPHAQYVVGFDQIFALPADLPSPGHAVTFAIRVWHWPRFPKGVSGGPTSSTRVGEIDALRTQQTYDAWGRFWSSSSGNVLMLMNLLAAFAGLFLFWMRPQDREYLWFGIYELLTGLDHLILDYYRFHPTPEWTIFWLDSAFSAASWFLFLLFIFTILNGRKNWLFWAAVATEVVTILGQLAFMMGWIGLVQFDLIWALALVPYFYCILGLLYQKATRGVPDAQLMLIPVGFCYVCWLARILLSALSGSGHTWVYRDLHWFFEVSRRPFPFSVNDLADMVMLVAVVAVLPLRFARSRRDEERLAGEMESARTVQQILIPNEIPPVPGFAIHCVYRPAGQVGGDFFQVIPLGSGGALIAVGDVSGKGMPAAMTVSLLVGTLRTLAHYTQRPSEIGGECRSSRSLSGGPGDRGRKWPSPRDHRRHRVSGSQCSIPGRCPAYSVHRWRGRGPCAVRRTVRLRSGRCPIHATRGGDRPNSAELRPGRRHHRAHRNVGSVSTSIRIKNPVTRRNISYPSRSFCNQSHCSLDYLRIGPSLGSPGLPPATLH
jgi:7TM diverse intracellular signalling/Stage II sporulation protein E (SpoIIE)